MSIANDPQNASWWLNQSLPCDFGSCGKHANALSVLVVDRWVEARPMCVEHAQLTGRIHANVNPCHTITV